MPYQTQPLTKLHRGAISPLELANRWGQSRQHIYDLLAKDQILSFKSGRSRLIPMSEILRIEGGNR